MGGLVGGHHGDGVHLRGRVDADHIAAGGAEVLTEEIAPSKVGLERGRDLRQHLAPIDTGPRDRNRLGAADGDMANGQLQAHERGQKIGVVECGAGIDPQAACHEP